MKTIIKTSLILLAFLSGLQIYAQDELVEEPGSQKKVSFSIRAGLNISNLTYLEEGHTYNEKLRVGYNIGAMMDYHLSKDFYIRTGLSLTSKGTKVNEMGFIDTDELFEVKMEAIYLQVPLYFTFKTALANTANKISVAGGPFFAYGIAGKNKYYHKTGGHYGDADTFGKDALWNSPDIGIGMEVTLEIQRLVFALGSEMGLAKVWKTGGPYIQEDVYMRNSTSYLSVGFNF